MGKLTDLLKSPRPDVEMSSNVGSIKNNSIGGIINSGEPIESSSTDTLDFDISDEELEVVRSSVVDINTNDKNRKQIIIGKFGGIKNPRTGKRFVIPGLDYSTENYIFKYADMMKTLVYRPDDFKKIMNWE